MTEDQFWEIIDRTTEFGADQNRQMKALTEELRKLSADKIQAFARRFDTVLRESYSWDLWGAAFVIMGGASDDSFEYFRVWLVSRGRATFEAAVKNPDRLASLIPTDFHDVPEFELLAYVSDEVWKEKSGREANAEFTRPAMAYFDQRPSGEPFAEDPKSLVARYPKLFDRFGKNPLF